MSVELDFLIIGMMLGGAMVGGPQIYMYINKLRARIASLEQSAPSPPRVEEVDKT